MGDRSIDDLIQRSRATRAAAEKACSDVIEIAVKARHDVRGLMAVHQRANEVSLFVGQGMAKHEPDKSADRPAMDVARSSDDLIRRNRELRAMAAAVRKETERLRASYVAIWGRSLDLLPRIRATWSVNAASRRKRRRSRSGDFAAERRSDGSSSAMDSQDADAER